MAYPLSNTTLGSHYELYDNGAFALQFPGIAEFRGTYKEDSGTITFNWEGSSVAGPWGATGTLANDRLVVRYNLIMQLSDFEDAAYALKK